jgi:plastocyanin
LKILARFAMLIVILSTFLTAQDRNVRGTVSVLPAKREFSNGDVVVSLTPTGAKEPVAPGPMARLLQKDKRFTPHVVAVPVGTAIEFPNRDPFFHDVFSLYHGKPFDLGLYESGSARSVRFTKPGVSYIFCNIHPDMSAVVVALPTPYFTLSARDGSFHIDHVPPGKYKLEVWYELASPADLASLTREVEITSAEDVLPAITLHASDSHSDHLNKYGEPYPLDKGSKY